MEIISIEGLDKSGKHSQTEMLTKSLNQAGFKTVKSEFHRYDTPTGELIMKWLTDNWDVDQRTIELIMAADKQAQQSWFNELEKDGVDFLILDRYTGSQQVYSMANGIRPYWIGHLQHQMRKPKLEIWIDITAEESMRRKGKHNNGENDRYESDLDMLKRVRQIYTERVGVLSNNVLVNGMQSIDDVQADIRTVIGPLIVSVATSRVVSE